ncbi:MAG: Smr/MutS family protein [Proteobacteria bacterium]|nr:Smr/MutS family protein [Pseudomonadota bacterium]
MESVLCAVCGNELERGHGQCPYCQAPRVAGEMGATGPFHRVVNLEKGMPQVMPALNRLEAAITVAGSQGYKALTLIHGYGSSGTGGAIKAAVQNQLQFLRLQGRIKEIVPGEEFEGRSKRGRHLLRRFPFLVGHRDLNRANPGITLVIL